MAKNCNNTLIGHIGTLYKINSPTIIPTFLSAESYIKAIHIKHLHSLHC